MPPNQPPPTEPSAAATAPRALRHVVADEPQAAAAELDGWQQRYQQLTPGMFRAEVSQVTYGDVHVFREQTTQALLEEGEAARGYLSLALPHVHCEDGWFHGYRMHGYSLLCAGNGQALAMRTPRELDLTGLTMPLPALDRAVALASGEPRRLDKLAGVRQLRPAVGNDLRAALLSVLATAAIEAEVFSNRFVESAIRDALLLAAATALIADDDRSREPLPTASARRQLVADAYALVRAAPDHGWSILALCERLGVSRRTLQYSFNEVTGLAPLDFVRAVRMNGVRLALRAGPVEPVGAVAAQFGFHHLPRFAAQYRAFFGELPSQTLARRRGSVQA
ncbi:helix-turn-helix domain-containing protein [Cupriavidus consociatus]|uniref:helix-turn-helix domain-containing protein n=1 Tax=Cupriavidus consociatus TaxID=2821357 RepID=UPI001AE57D9F|nr:MULTISPECIES: helix-turn-helix domain-containing protein [unclassified Cupriavidus]MBP0623251.1 helix-turn-helix domain-containing protein [Cupriavidus sp. LEh25]MDK2659944.1 helix-turn-helix domain-containing protein [Cupriavidus sp. LEh21]